MTVEKGSPYSKEQLQGRIPDLKGRSPLQAKSDQRLMWALVANRQDVVQQQRYPHPCGFFNDPSRECTCTPPIIQRYVSKISGPLLDRIDIHIDMPAVRFQELRQDAGGELSEGIRERVVKARERQLERFQGEKIYCNAQMSSRQIRKYCNISAECERLLESAMSRLGLSARAHDRILKVARTIADLESIEDIATAHVSEAIQYRSLDRNYWT